MAHDRAWLEEEVDRIFPTVISPSDGVFGQWINGLWTWHPDLDFAEQKEAFFILLERLLREGHIKFVKPDADVYFSTDLKTGAHYRPSQTINDPSTHWDIPASEIIDYLQSRWPLRSATHNDIELHVYFFEIPSIIWRKEDGTWHGS